MERAGEARIAEFVHLDDYRRRALLLSSISTLSMGVIIGPARVATKSGGGFAVAVAVGWLVFTVGSAITLGLTRAGRYPSTAYLATVLAVISIFAVAESTVIFLICVTLGLAFVLQVATALESPRTAMLWTGVVAVASPVLVLARHQLEPIGIVESWADWVALLLGPPLALMSIGATGILTLGALRSVLIQAHQRAEALANATEALEGARDEAMSASRAKSAFLANMSHELRTPMNAVIGYSELILEDTDEDFDFRPEVGHVLSAGHHLLRLIDEVLDLSKIEVGRLEILWRDVDLTAIVTAVADTIRPALTPGVALRVECPSLAIRTDPTRLQQVLTNIVGNAVKFTREGEVSICVSVDGAEVRIMVADTGPGIPADALENLFEPFIQGDGSSTRVHGGTGLGLAIARRLCRLLDGDLAVETCAGEGSTFTVSLPYSDTVSLRDDGGGVVR